ncbi:hypothetical protein SAMN05421748_107195 [Paractinoplanes atraurantiacus]|uniref:Uncharacterized protein n=2 Tax=Paractinoplanes atraurantiacus TaxID=1036182 RepID=A0A285IB88_9ACTN|nr:hypothetical protein SAMN05421748_107195 [Actinoplanes atraurantiacus]
MMVRGGSTLRCDTHRARVEFDGTAVTVWRRFASLLPWRMSRYELWELLEIGWVSLGGEGERRRLSFHLAWDRPSVQITVGFGRDPHHAQPQELLRRWDELVRAISTALASWQRRALEETTGLGPWNEAVWRRVEAIAPEVHVFTEWAGEFRMGDRKPWTHREQIENNMLAPLRGQSGSGGRHSVGESSLERVREQAWTNLVRLLDDERQRSGAAPWPESSAVDHDATTPPV